MGNVECRLVGPAPRQRLDQALNPRYRPIEGPGDPGAPPGVPLVYDPCRDLFLTGALPRVKRVLRETGIRFRVRDRRTIASRCDDWRLRDCVLRDYQEEVVQKAIASGHGLIDIGTSGGKSILASAIIARLGLPTIFLVTTQTLLAQTVQNLNEHLGVEPGVIGQGERKPARLTVALIQSMDPERVDFTIWDGGTLIFDEGHHAAAGTYQELIRRLNPRYHYYLSAVPFRSGQDQAVLNALAGEKLTEGKYSAQFLIEKGFACPVHVRVERIRTTGMMAEKTFLTLYREFIVLNESRNQRIAEIARAETAVRRSVLILVDHVRHGRQLFGLLGEGEAQVAFVHGSTPRAEVRTLTARFAAGELPCLIATSGLFMEGVSINGIHVLIQAGGLKSRSKVIQTVGRGMRKAPGKEVCTYVDFWDDDTAGVFRGHSRQRLRILKEEGFFVPAVGESEIQEAGVEPAQGGSARSGDAAVAGTGKPVWAHVPDTKRFVLVDDDGRVHAKALCVVKGPVPEQYCKRCKNTTICSRGGTIVWQDASA